MTPFVIAFAAVAVYLFIGLRYIAPKWVVRELARNIESWPGLASDASEVARWRREAAGLGIGIAMIWPAYLAGRFLTRKIAGVAPLTDFEAKQKIAERDQRIAELERQLEVGQ